MSSRQIAAVTLLLVLCLPAFFWNRTKVFQKSRALIDTIVTITVVSDSSEKAEKAIDAAFSSIDRFGAKIDFYSSESELASVNNSAGIKPVRVSDDTFDLMQKAVEVAKVSDGAFDPTIGPVIRLWDFHEKKKPADHEVQRLLPLVNYRNIVIDRNEGTVFLRRKGMLVDLGGIAKGFCGNLAARQLKQQGIQSGLVAIAGDITAFGTKPDGTPWQIGIRNPRQTGEKDALMATLGMLNRSISTSGDYERYFIEAGVRYHHLLDPKTGFPSNASMSASVISDAGYLSDAISTAMFILGPERGLRLAAQLGVDAIIVDAGKRIHMSEGLRGKITIVESH